MNSLMSGRILIPLFIVFFLPACAQKQYKFEYIQQPIQAEQKNTLNKLSTSKEKSPGQGSFNEQEIVWPPAPDKARYRYLGDIVGERNFKEIEGSEGGIRKGISWLGRFIFGVAAPMQLYRPQSGAFDKKNNRIFVTDVGLKKVFVFDLTTKQLTTWEGGGLEQSFMTPIAIAILASGDVLITDADLGQVLRFDEQGKYLGVLGQLVSEQKNTNKHQVKEKQNGEVAYESGDNLSNNLSNSPIINDDKKRTALARQKLLRPTGIAYDPETRKIFVADSQTHQVHIFSENGQWLSAFGGKGAKNGKFNSPTHLFIADKTLFVSDTLNARIQQFDVKANWLHSFGQRGLKVGNTPRPKGIAVDSDANIYVVESYYDHLLMFNVKGEALMAIGGTGSEPGKFDLPAGVWVDDSDKVYVADMFNQRISVFQYLSENDK